MGNLRFRPETVENRGKPSRVVDRLAASGDDLSAAPRTLSDRMTSMKSIVAVLFVSGLLMVGEPARAEETGRTLTIVPFPFLFYQEETKLGGGGSLSLITRRQVEGARAENSGLLFLYTERNQYSILAEVERYLDAERWHVRALVGFEEFPADYFGRGNDNPSDGDEVFTPRGFVGEVSVQNQFSGRWRVGPRLRVRTREMVEREEAGLLEIQRPNGWDGADVVALGAALVHDGRDHVFYPTRGWWMRAGTDVALTSLGSDDAFAEHSLDLRRYQRLGERGPILAVRALARHSTGNVPFDLLPALGGAQLLRGFFGGRFRDRTLYAVQSELRVGHWRRLGAVGFVEAGRVTAGLDALSIADLHVSYGFGVRFQLSAEEKLHVRADFGFTDEGDGGFYLNFQEAF